MLFPYLNAPPEIVCTKILGRALPPKKVIKMLGYAQHTKKKTVVNFFKAISKNV